MDLLTITNKNGRVLFNMYSCEDTPNLFGYTSDGHKEGAGVNLSREYVLARGIQIYSNAKTRNVSGPLADAFLDVFQEWTV